MIFSKMLVVSKQIWCHGLKSENNFQTYQRFIPRICRSEVTSWNRLFSERSKDGDDCSNENKPKSSQKHRSESDSECESSMCSKSNILQECGPKKRRPEPDEKEIPSEPKPDNRRQKPDDDCDRKKAAPPECKPPPPVKDQKQEKPDPDCGKKEKTDSELISDKMTSKSDIICDKKEKTLSETISDQIFPKSDSESDKKNLQKKEIDCDENKPQKPLEPEKPAEVSNKPPDSEPNKTKVDCPKTMDSSQTFQEFQKKQQKFQQEATEMYKNSRIPQEFQKPLTILALMFGFAVLFRISKLLAFIVGYLVLHKVLPKKR